MPKKSLEQKLADLEREEESKVKRRRQRKYDERLEKGKQKAERKADEVERKVRLTYKKKKEKIKRLAKGLSSMTPAEKRKRERDKLLRQASGLFSESVRITGAWFDVDTMSFMNVCYTSGKEMLVCKWDGEKWRRNNALQNGHMVKKGRGNALKFYRPVCRPQSVGDNVFKQENQKARELKRKKDVGQEEYDKAIFAKGQPKSFTIEYLQEVIKESKAIIQQKFKESEKYINIT